MLQKQTNSHVHKTRTRAPTNARARGAPCKHSRAQIRKGEVGKEDLKKATQKMLTQYTGSPVTGKAASSVRIAR